MLVRGQFKFGSRGICRHSRVRCRGFLFSRWRTEQVRQWRGANDPLVRDKGDRAVINEVTMA